MKKLKKILFIILLVIGSLLLTLGLALLVGYINHKSISKVEVKERIENNTGVVLASGRGLYEPNGNEIVLEGVNIGNLFVTEGWISPYKTSTMENEQLSEEMFREALKNNPNLDDEKIYNILDTYYKNWFTKDDVKSIKELGMNCIRLPFYYKNILNDDLTRKNESEAFKYIDPIISWAKEYGIYVILDLHGCPGSQNGYEHSGSIDYDKYDKETIKFFYTEEYIKAVIDLWVYISEHYNNTELSSTIAAYDIMNEPRSRKFVTDKDCWDVFDRIYDAIRDNNDNHNIIMEGCWSFSALPNPKDYEWENVTYSYHWYNWANQYIVDDVFYIWQDLSNIGRNYDVPVFIGEFTYFENEDNWNKGLSLFRERHYSWTIWTYKKAVCGWWNDSWGLYNINYWDNNNDKEVERVNVDTATYEEILEAFSKLSTKDYGNKHSYVKYTTYNTLKKFFENNPR